MDYLSILRSELSPIRNHDHSIFHFHHVPLLQHYLSSVMAATMPSKEASGTPIAVSFPLPRAPQTEIHVQLINTGVSLLVFLTTTTPTPSAAAPLGSFVYAMPNVRSPFVSIAILAAQLSNSY